MDLYGEMMRAESVRFHLFIAVIICIPLFFGLREFLLRRTFFHKDKINRIFLVVGLLSIPTLPLLYVWLPEYCEEQYQQRQAEESRARAEAKWQEELKQMPDGKYDCRYDRLLGTDCVIPSGKLGHWACYGGTKALSCQVE